MKNYYNFFDEGFPTRNFLLGHIKPHLRPVRNDYEDISQYQAIHSNLLLEDFLPSLRNPLRDIRRRTAVDGAWVYREVRLISFLENGVLKWRLNIPDNNGRLPAFGHLLVFSRGGFDKDLFLGMIRSPNSGFQVSGSDGVSGSSNEDTGSCYGDVCDHKQCGERDCENDDESDDTSNAVVSGKGGNSGTSDKKQDDKCHVVQLKLLEDYQPSVTELEKGTFIMLETKPFFYMYYHVLRDLNRLDEFSFPMQNIILNCRAYNDGLAPGDMSERIFTRSFSLDMCPNFRNWLLTKAHNLGFNVSQVNSLKHTLKGGISLIQGPPGTGKTFFGVRLVKLYLDSYRTNYQIGEKSRLKPPYFLICQTNRALDNFLQKLIELNDKEKDISIVRIGDRRCNNMRVTPYCLTERVCRRLSIDGLGLRRLLGELHTRRLQLFEVQRNIEAAIPPISPELSQLLIRNKRRVHKLEKDVRKFYWIFNPTLRLKTQIDILRDAHVIGMTTTGAASHFDILKKYLPGVQIVIVEEAAAVLESHVVVSVPNSCSCLVMLGDHKQLQPCLTNHLLEEYRFNISLFERLINNRHPVICLNPQYRMRPEISALLRGIPHFYATLADGPGTHERPLIEEDESVIFYDHIQEESRVPSLHGYCNTHEVNVLTTLARALVAAGHSQSDIAIISMYQAQRQRLEQARNRSPSIRNVEIGTVDSFQGKEKEIILVSLVRSNPEGQIGFLTKPNRVCVALSRARSGLFIVGNMDCLLPMNQHNNSNHWVSVNTRLVEQGALTPVPEFFIDDFSSDSDDSEGQ